MTLLPLPPTAYLLSFTVVLGELLPCFAVTYLPLMADLNFPFGLFALAMSRTSSLDPARVLSTKGALPRGALLGCWASEPLLR